MREVTIGDCRLINGDCLEVMAALPENSVDAIVCDPPYHLTSIVKRFADGAPAQYGTDGAFARASAGFMGKQWDGGDIAFRPETWAKALRVLKPGGYILAFASTRGFGRMSVALEDAGFITHPLIAWIFGSGFPKATRIKADGYDGWRYGGQALKPAIEPIYMGQKPFSEKSGTANIERWGTGAINIDGCRAETSDNLNGGAYSEERKPSNSDWVAQGGTIHNSTGKEYEQPSGRWPANLIHDGSDEVLAAFPTSKSTQGKPRGAASGEGWGMTATGAEYSDSGSAARFFYCAKASRKDREEGLDEYVKREGGMVYNTSGRHITRRDDGYNPEPRANTHPTVKPTALMEYLVRLVTPTGGTVLDPFMGSGSTGKACVFEGFQFIGIEREEEYFDIARGRIQWAVDNRGMLDERPVAAPAQVGAPTAANDNQRSLFDAA